MSREPIFTDWTDRHGALWGHQLLRLQHRLHTVSIANGLLRHRLGLPPRSRAVTGPSYWSKDVLQKALGNSRWVKHEHKVRRQIDFRLGGANPGQIIDARAAA